VASPEAQMVEDELQELEQHNGSGEDLHSVQLPNLLDVDEDQRGRLHKHKTAKWKQVDLTIRLRTIGYWEAPLLGSRRWTS
jgi:hypothetical protein